MTIVDGLMIFALILGPTLAVLITKYYDKKQEAQRRKWEIFRDLMCYRSDGVSQGFVSSLNLIEVEFHDNESVLAAWKSCMSISVKQNLLRIIAKSDSLMSGKS
jgi:hypothetical protein